LEISSAGIFYIYFITFTPTTWWSLVLIIWPVIKNINVCSFVLGLELSYQSLSTSFSCGASGPSCITSYHSHWSQLHGRPSCPSLCHFFGVNSSPAVTLFNLHVLGTCLFNEQLFLHQALKLLSPWWIISIYLYTCNLSCSYFGVYTFFITFTPFILKTSHKYTHSECNLLFFFSCSENSGLHVFDFLANSILKEVLSAIQKGKPGAFSPGRPTEFLINYKSSLDFLAHLEGSTWHFFFPT
jgi:hypothetical protein